VKRILVNSKTSYVMESLATVGWSEDSVVSLDSIGPSLQCEYLLATSPISSGYIPDRVFDSVKSLLGIEYVGSGGRYYISREDSAIRRVKNESEVLGYLEKHGFRKLVLDGKSVTEQAKLFACAEWIVAPHGAGLTNILFCASGTKVLEFYPEGYSCLTYFSMSDVKGLLYGCTAFPPLDASHPKASDYVVELSKLEAMLLRMGIS
jgi:hypothetical protein